MQYRKSKTQRGWLLTISLLLIILVLSIGLAAFANQMQRDGKIMTYEQCAASNGAVIQESYPSVCITKSGERFVNPKHQRNCFRGWASSNPSCK